MCESLAGHRLRSQEARSSSCRHKTPLSAPPPRPGNLVSTATDKEQGRRARSPPWPRPWTHRGDLIRASRNTLASVGVRTLVTGGTHPRVGIATARAVFTNSSRTCSHCQLQTGPHSCAAKLSSCFSLLPSQCTALSKNVFFSNNFKTVCCDPRAVLAAVPRFARLFPQK